MFQNKYAPLTKRVFGAAQKKTLRGMVQPFQLLLPLTVQNEKWNLIPKFHFQMMIAIEKEFFSSAFRNAWFLRFSSTYD